MNTLAAVAGGSTLIYAVLATLMGVMPGIELSHVPAGPNVKPLTPLEARGREIYVGEGCAYCHTQQVRPLRADKIFGRPSQAGDFAYDTPELLGSERTGPDLTNVGARRPSAIWQYIHLYDPRAVVPQSIMPSFRWLFFTAQEAPKGAHPVPIPKAYAPSHGVVVPTKDGRALVSYLLSLKQPSLSGRSTGRVSAKAAVAAAKTPIPRVAKQASGGVTFDAAKGASLFANNCAVCHGANGAGVPGAFPPLKGDPVVTATDPTEHMTVVLHGRHGVPIRGKTYQAQMPAFAPLLSDAEIAAIIDHERTSWGNHAPTVTAKDVAATRAKK